MGTWSRPFHVTVFPGSPTDYHIDHTKLSEHTIREWQHAGFFPDTSLKLINLVDFMNTGCDSHKIMDHMNNAQIQRWLGLFKHILEVNPALDKATFHFFCLDAQEPYYFEMRRNEADVTNNTLYMYVGQSESIHYFDKNAEHNDNEDDLADSRALIFNEERYKNVWRKCDFRCLRLRVDYHSHW